VKSINKVILKGRLGDDPKSSATSTGKIKTAFSVATDESWKDKDGKWQSITEWHNVVIWKAPLAEVVAQNVKKGDCVSVEGKIKTRSYEKDGVKKYITEVVADNVDLIQAWPKAETPQGEPDKNDLPF
jgi:single-strand DNA-binding protein